MPTDYFTIEKMLIALLYCISYFISAKILSYDLKPRCREIIFIVFFSLTLAGMTTLIRGLSVIPISSAIISLLVVFFILIYLHKVQRLTIKTAINFALASFLITLISDNALFYAIRLILSEFRTDAHIVFFIFFPLFFVLCAVLSYLCVRKFRKLYISVTQSTSLHLKLTLISTGLFFLYLTFIAISELGYQSLTLFSWSSMFILLFSIAILVAFAFFTKEQHAQLEIRGKETEQKHLQFYIEQIENQQASMRKFKHDYQNILLSIKCFLDDENFDALKQFYNSSIAPTSVIITNGEFALEALNKIKVSEIKGILATKLILAQKLDIDVTFECDQEIESIAIDSIVLLRMLGIILDNSIEELESLGAGALSVACFKVNSTVNFVVSNTCRADMPPLSCLVSSGFSTKGEGRGLGLSNLSELARVSPNVTLKTDIKSGNFVQRLVIGG